MSTRSAVEIRQSGHILRAYKHWDGYFSGTGVAIIKAIYAAENRDAISIYDAILKNKRFEPIDSIPGDVDYVYVIDCKLAVLKIFKMPFSFQDKDNIESTGMFKKAFSFKKNRIVECLNYNEKMSTNYYRIRKMSNEQRSKKDFIDNWLDLEKFLQFYIYDDYPSGVCSDFFTKDRDWLHIGKYAGGWRFLWDIKMLALIYQEYKKEIESRPDPGIFYKFWNGQPVVSALPDHLCKQFCKITVDDVKRWLSEGEIFDEYERQVSVDELFKIVAESADGAVYDEGLDDELFPPQYKQRYMLDDMVFYPVFSNWA